MIAYRNLHRWVSLPVVLFMMFITVTGVVLSVQEMQGEGARNEARPALPRPANEALLVAATAALPAVQAADPDLKLQRIEFGVSSAGTTAKFFPTNRRAPGVEVELASGAIKKLPPPGQSLHGLFVTLHSGKWFGIGGLVVVLICGLALAVLSVTGLLVYIDMWRRRRGAGKHELFWR
jgi:uncharacterized iron-regulated membrane protein